MIGGLNIMKRGSIYIIPDEEQILDDLFYKEVEKSHLSAIKDFVSRYKLGYSFKDDEYHEAPCILASDGHMIIKIDNLFSNVIFYIPEFVTDRQNIWTHNNVNLLMGYKSISGYKVKKDNDKYITNEIEDLNNIIKAINHGNILYNKRGRDRHVR